MIYCKMCPAIALESSIIEDLDLNIMLLSLSNLGISTVKTQCAFAWIYYRVFRTINFKFFSRRFIIIIIYLPIDLPKGNDF